MLASVYRILTSLSGPFVSLWLRRRARVGKEDVARIGERFGRSALKRPAGKLVWFHAASVGEANSVLVLVRRLLDGDPTIHVLMTTGTVNSAALMGKRLPARALHQYAPVDLPGAVGRFLDHWRPDAALWTESEIWPNMLTEIRKRGIPAAVVNARLSERSFLRWLWLPGVISGLLRAFSISLAQTEEDASRLRRLGAENVIVVGNLKFSADPPEATEDALDELRSAIAARPAWIFASAHPGEHELAIRVHEAVATKLPNLLTIIVPRHAERGPEILDVARERGLGAARRSEGALPHPEHAVYIGDTMGELGVFYRLVPVVCMGGSFIRHGGQNPVEPALFGCAVVYGPHMWNFAEITRQLEEAEGALPVPDPETLSKTICRLVSGPEERARIGQAARQVTERNRQAVDRAINAIAPLLRQAGVAVSGS